MAKSKWHEQAVAASKATPVDDYLYGLTHAGTESERWVGPYPDVSGADLWARYTRSESGRWQLSGVVLLGEAITSAQLRKVPVAALENSWNLSAADPAGRREKIRDLPPLVRTEDISPMDFSRLVADYYTKWSALVDHPVAAMRADATEAAGVDVTAATVHSWVREARLRGFLPPGRERKNKGSSNVE